MIHSAAHGNRTKRYLALALSLIIGVGVIALILRLWFIFEVSQIEVLWDANDYWSEMQLVRNRICSTLGYCTPDPSIAANTPFSSLMRGVLFERLGIMPFLGGIALTILPVEPLSINILYAVLGSLICLMIISVLLRLGFPLWIALLGGIFHALYVPAITGEGAVLQQPFIRLCLALVVWAYTLAFTSHKRLFIWFWVGLATTASILVGYASITTRPLMWLIPLSVLLLTWRSAPRVFRVQLVYLGLLVGTMIAATILLTVRGQETLDSAARLSTGLGAQGDSISSATTIATFPHIWAPSEWWRDFPGGSLGSDFARDPALFLNRFVYSVFANWRYPDYFYLQHFILTLEGQKIQHLLLVISGLLGIAGLLGQPGLRRRTALLILVIALYVSVSSSVISMEPRRISVLSPILTIGAAVFIGSVVAGIRSYRRTLEIDALLLALGGTAWWLPLPLLLEFVRIEPAVAYALLVTLRAVLTVMVIWRLLRLWERNEPQFGKRWAAGRICC
ncbi:MAG: hypothetical protein H7175_04145 [Burkholderiales bacterium]|nr:hypothetical protein [Anaerolineae bacterium]